ncbi:MAG TPA: DUF3105 domain-containing protein [Deinococcales bacterium]|nr:DUF3105 domain-containing protein [Deinococcales bacterium]
MSTRTSARPASARPSQTVRRRNPLVLPAIVVVTAAMMGGGWYLAHPSVPQLGQTFASQGQEHITLGAPHAPYNSYPPTSGPHTAEVAPWGVSQQPIAQETLIHNLEHGGIVIQYRPGLDSYALQSLADLAAKFPSKIVVVPNAQLKSALAVTAWTHLLSLDKFDPDLVNRFVGLYKDKAPEFFPD